MPALRRHRFVWPHDRTLDRITTGRGRVRDISSDDFAALRLRDVSGRTLTEAPPTLRAALGARSRARELLAACPAARD